MWFLGSIVVFVCIAAALIFTGLLILFATRSPVNRKSIWQVSAVDIAISAFLGTAFWIFLSGTLSYSGFTFNQTRPWTLTLLAGLVALVFFLWIRKRIGQPVTGVAFRVLGAGFLAGSTSLLPLALKNTFLLAMDPYTYVIISDFLQTHNFLAPIQTNISFPAFGEAISYQQHGLRMGANFLLALTTSWLPSLRSVNVYPAVLAWGLALNVFGLFLYMRWVLKSTYSISILPLFFVALTPNPVQSSAAWGFFPQTLGTAFLLFSMAILSKVLSNVHFSIKTALWLGISWAAMVSVYSELFPILGLISMFSILLNVRRFTKRGKLQCLFKTILVALGSGLFCANYEWLRIISAIQLQMQNVVGWPIRLDFFELWSDAIGAKPVILKWNIGFLIIATGLSLLWLAGMLVIIKKKQIIPLSILIVWLVMIFYFWLTKDVNPSRTTWSIYKITQWSSLSLLAVAFFSLRSFKLVHTKLLSTVIALVCIAGFLPLVSIFNFHGEAMREVTGTDNPIEDYFQLARVIKAYKKTNVYQVSTASQWPRILPSYFLMDQAFLLGSWDGIPASGTEQVGQLRNSDTLFYCLACPFPNPRNALLPANSVIIQQPVISDINTANFNVQRQKINIQVLETENVCLTIFSISSGNTDVWVQSNPAQLHISNKQDWKTELSIADGNPKSKIEFPTQKGYNALCIKSNPSASITILNLNLTP